MGTAPTKTVEQPVTEPSVASFYNGGNTSIVVDLETGSQLDIEQTLTTPSTDHLAALVAAGHLTLVKES